MPATNPQHAKHAPRFPFNFILLLAAALCLPAVAPAQTVDWIFPGDGVFAVNGNWSTGFAPGVPNTARFNLDQTYTVIFNSSPTNAALLVDAGDVTFQPFMPFNRTYSLNGQSIVDGGDLTVRGAGGLTLLVDVAGTLSIGTNGTGSLAIENGVRVQNTQGTIGINANGTGMVTVDGAGASWANSANLVVGSRGDGTLEINGGASVSSDNQTQIAAGVGGTGRLTVQGAGSTLSAATGLLVGRFGDGTLSIADGGSVSTTFSNLGVNAGAIGRASVDGNDSFWTNTAEMLVGTIGTGMLEITAGGSVSNTTGTIGEAAGGSGAVTVDGAGSTWTNSGLLFVGNSGDGALAITDGGSVASSTAAIGDDAGSTGQATVDGAGSTWATGTLFVGHFGNGSLEVTNGGVVNSGASAPIAHGPSSTGSASLSGAGTMWNVTGGLPIGSTGGRGILNVTSGAAVTSTQLANIGRNSVALVDGPDSTFSAAGLDVRGTMTVANGGQLLVTGGLIGGTGPLNLVGGVITAGRIQNFGFNWISGELNLTDPRGVNSAGPALRGAITLVSDKTLNVTHALDVGAGSSLALLGGELSAGSLFVTGGNVLGTEPLDLAADVADNTLVARGNLNTPVAGNTASEIAVTGPLTMGNLGSADGYDYAGALHVRNQEVVLLDADRAELGAQTTIALGGRLTSIHGAALGPGEVLTAGAGAPLDLPGLRTTAGLRLVEIGGGLGAGNLAPAGTPFAVEAFPGVLLAENLNDEDFDTRWIGENDTFAGIALDSSTTVSSIAWGQNAQGVNLGNEADYLVQFRNDGLTADDGAWTTIGQATYEQGELSGRHRFDFDPVQATAVRLGIFNVQAASGLTIIAEIELFADAAEQSLESLIDGDFTNNGTVHGPAGPGELLVFNDNVDGAGSYTGNIQFNQGFSPGNSPGTVQMENLTLVSTADLLIELAGTLSGEFDRLELSGDASLAGELFVSLLNSFAPAPGDQFEILDVAGTLTGQFAGLDEGALLLADTGQQFRITYTGGDGNNVVLTAVPEPGSIVLLLLASVGLVSVRRSDAEARRLE